MFNKTYKQISGYISRKGINEIPKFSYSNFFTKLGVFTSTMGFVFGLYTVGTEPAQGDWGEVENRVVSILINIMGLLVKISDLIFLSMLLVWVIMLYYSRGTASVQGSLIGLIWVITTSFSISPISTLVLIIVQGWISFFAQLFIIFMYLYVPTYIWIMKIHGRETKIGNLGMTIATLELMLIINIIMVIYLAIAKHLNSELALISVSVIPYILVISLLFYQLDRAYEVTHIQRHNRQFRVACEIPDKKWWSTAKKAVKHPRVYPPAEDETKGEYKDGR